MAGNLNYTLRLDAGGFLNPMRAAQGALRGLLSTGSNIGNIATGLQSAKGILAGVLDVLSRPVTLAADLESITAEFEVMLGSGKAAQRMLRDIQKFAAATPFETEGLARNAKLLLSFGIAGNKVIPTLRMLGDVAGSDQERLNSLALAFAQVSANGRLTGGDLLQMINAGFNPLNEIARTTGRSMASLRKDMEAGAIGADLVEAAFRAATTAGGRFAGNTVKQSGALKGLFSTLRDGWAEVQRTFGMPIAMQLKPVIQEGIKSLSSIVPLSGQIGAALAGALQTAFAVVKNGDLGKVLKMGLSLAFREAVNGFVATFYAGAKAIGPLLLSAFSISMRFLASTLPSIGTAIGKGIAKAIEILASIGELISEAFNDPATMKGLKASFHVIMLTFRLGLLETVAAILDQIPGMGGAAKRVREDEAFPLHGMIMNQSEIADRNFARSKSRIGQGIAGIRESAQGGVFDFSGAITTIGGSLQTAAREFSAAFAQAPKVFDTSKDRSDLNRTIAADVRKLTARPIPVQIINQNGANVGGVF